MLALMLLPLLLMLLICLVLGAHYRIEVKQELWCVLGRVCLENGRPTDAAHAAASRRVTCRSRRSSMMFASTT